MKWQSIIIVLALAVFGRVEVGWVMLGGPKEPVYQGKPISYWIEQPDLVLLTGSDFGRRSYFPITDTNALPYLVKYLRRRRDAPFHDYYFNLYVRKIERWPKWLRSLLPAPCLDASGIRGNAAQALGVLGAKAKTAVPALIGVLKNDVDSNVREHAAAALGRIASADENVIETPVQALKDEAPTVRLEAVKALGQIGPAAKAAIPDLTRHLGDGDYTVRISATNALKKIDPEAVKKAGAGFPEGSQGNDRQGNEGRRNIEHSTFNTEHRIGSGGIADRK